MTPQFNTTKERRGWAITFEDADSGSKVVDSSGSLEGSGDDGG